MVSKVTTDNILIFLFCKMDMNRLLDISGFAIPDQCYQQKNY